MLPFLTYTRPQAARAALRFRYTLLDAARRRAHELAQDGALFPWRTINGEEASAYYAAGTAQYHINADIAYALAQYVAASGDLDFLVREGIDVLVETARMWADLGFWFNDNGGSFHIHGVTGPDEYTTVVNDNLFTNVMARFNLRRAAEAVRELREIDGPEFDALVERLELEASEIDEWERAAEGMSIPFDEHLGVHPQDLHFLEREVWDLAHTPLEKRPLLLHYHPLVIYRFQVLKQADVVLALFLQGELFTAEQKRADFEYYDPITTGDSTLSGVVQSIIAAEVGYDELALRYFLGALFVDLADLHHNTADGVHVASTGGVWSALVYGFGGFRDYGGRVRARPATSGDVGLADLPPDVARQPGARHGASGRARPHHRGGRGGDARRARRVGHRHRGLAGDHPAQGTGASARRRAGAGRGPSSRRRERHRGHRPGCMRRSRFPDGPVTAPLD